MTTNTILKFVKDLQVGDVIVYKNHFLTVESVKQIKAGKRDWAVNYFSQLTDHDTAILGGSDSVHVTI